MSFSRILKMVIISLTIVMYSCKEEDVVDCTSKLSKVVSDQVTYFNARGAYNAEKSNENCRAARAAAQALINSTNDALDCDITSGQRVEFEGLRSDAEDTLSSVIC